ncbi:hypothetical protein MP638_003117, partial [Amoeboaphelidium occidentale]
MKQPPGFITKGSERKVLKLNKALYGLKQAPRQWNVKLKDWLLKNGFQICKSDSGVYFNWSYGVPLILTVYVDDVLLFSPDLKLVNKIIKDIAQHFKINELGPVKYVIGLEIERDRKSKTLSISQRKYTLDLLKRFNMAD